MDPIQVTALAFLVGLTASGLAGSLMELLSGRVLAFRDPYVSRAHVLRSLAVTVIAGPFMLANDALSARREGRISNAALLSCFCTSTLWLWASGTLLIAAGWNIGKVAFAV